jgi:excisionase family DNA binding protein
MIHKDLSTPDSVGLLAAIRRRDPGHPTWDAAAAAFTDYDARSAQDRIMRALILIYQVGDLRAGPIILALLARRIGARCNGEAAAIAELSRAVLEVCQRIEMVDRPGLAQHLVTTATDRIAGRGPLTRITPIDELVPGNTDLLSSGDAEAVLGVDRRTLTRWVESGHIEAVRTPGGHYRFPRTEVERLRRPQARPGPPQASGRQPTHAAQRRNR